MAETEKTTGEKTARENAVFIPVASEKEKYIICDMCGHANPENKAMCDMCSNYLKR